MISLRLIILITGLVIIGIIYFWETARLRQQQRKQTIAQGATDSDFTDLRITPRLDVGEDISGAISDLNNFLGQSKKLDEHAIAAQPFLVDAVKNDAQAPVNSTAPAVVHHPDLFPAGAEGGETNGGELPAAESNAVTSGRIITLHVTAPPANTFSGGEIIDAMNSLGLQYGAMDVFHHFGLGNMQGDEALFSLVDMFEPGSFDIDRMESHKTRGLSLFMCLPTVVDAQIVFELMLNTAQRLSDMLGGEVRGPDHKLINDDHLFKIREIINNYND